MSRAPKPNPSEVVRRAARRDALGSKSKTKKTPPVLAPPSATTSLYKSPIHTWTLTPSADPLGQQTSVVAVGDVRQAEQFFRCPKIMASLRASVCVSRQKEALQGPSVAFQLASYAGPCVRCDEGRALAERLGVVLPELATEAPPQPEDPDAPKKPRSPARGNKLKVCGRCGQMGHNRRTCDRVRADAHAPAPILTSKGPPR